MQHDATDHLDYNSKRVAPFLSTSLVSRPHMSSMDMALLHIQFLAMQPGNIAQQYIPRKAYFLMSWPLKLLRQLILRPGLSKRESMVLHPDSLARVMPPPADKEFFVGGHSATPLSLHTSSRAKAQVPPYMWLYCVVRV